MTIRRTLVLLAAGASALLIGAPAAGAQTSTCPGTFTVLHRDRVGSMAVPAGAYSVRTIRLSCGSASALISRFLSDFDGVLPDAWTTASSGVGFINPSTGSSISLGTPSRPSGRKGCPGTFTVEHNDRIGALALRSGAYRITTRRLSCAAASRQLAFFLFHDFAGRLPSGWRLNLAAQRFSRGRSSFTVKRAKRSRSGGGVHPNLAITCPGSVTLAAGTTIGTLVLPAGRYYVNVFSNFSCPRATKAFTQFAAAGALPAPWTFEPETATFLLGKEGFQIEPVS